MRVADLVAQRFLEYQSFQRLFGQIVQLHCNAEWFLGHGLQ
jgi:hypothetical protein